MGFLRIRTTVDERPGRLASLAAALAGRGGNILGMSVQTDTDGTVDEFMADIPASPEAVREALEGAGGRRVQVVPATAHELTDEPTRALLLAARLRAAPWRLPEFLGELLRADDARWVYGAAVSDSGERAATANGHDGAADDSTGETGGINGEIGGIHGEIGGINGEIGGINGEIGGDVNGEIEQAVRLPDPTLLTVPVAPRRFVRLRRSELPFTLTEAARAAAFVRLAQPPADPVGSERPVRLADGAEVIVRQLTPIYRDAVRDLHERCSPETRRFRYFTAMPTLPPRVFDRLCDRGRGHSLVGGHDGQVVALANLMFTADPGIAEMAFLIEDRWQGRGLGGSMARMLVREARDLGFAEVRATMLSDNVRMRRLMLSLGATLSYTEDPGVLEARLPVGVMEPC
ncbi:RimJ/RimL family protein N-acetyltransferase [Thermocatellispora tengchongensis]|uniref:RimJ/RimL family protein N-acetyltransferase n=1 Tax=Thermocatellispora tengchongensis TaxID=1073253 RepID=A0A840PET7_9ACTN|nr:GNAT family N-acetyltransferase [Thermocatellispora tengchongensis]MBB5135970.1 RimJ/RimL family protein N-acetyltransferase [Thermocatellispora tengchongensis]